MASDPHVHLNLNVRGMRHSATVAINERSNELLASGREIFKLGLGQSPFPVPGPVVQALRDNAHQKDYLAVKGLRPLRQAVSAYHRRRQGVERSGDDVLVGPGSKELMFLLQLVYYGDLVIPAPAWVSYAPQARIVGRHVHLLPTDKHENWKLSPERLQHLCDEDPGRPRIVMLNYPSNPTGLTFDDGELRELAQVARRNRLVLLSDEIYGELHHQGRHVSIATHYPEGTIISGGLSKWCGAGGWRLGTFLFPPQMRWLLDAMSSVASETFTSTSAPIQYAAIHAFDGGPELDTYLVKSRQILAALGTWIAGHLSGAGVHCGVPDGAFYLFPDFSPHAEALARRGITTSAGLCARLLEETGVAMLPGADFGRPASELTVRLAYVDFDGGAALEAVQRQDFVADERFLRTHCPRVIGAIERVVDWLN